MKAFFHPRRFASFSFSMLSLLCFLNMIVTPALADAPPNSEINAIYQYPNWVADNCSGSESDTTTPTTSAPVTAGTGAPDGAQFPNLDPTDMANAIDTFVEKENPQSKMIGLGQTIVADGKNANVNPFLIVAIADEESSTADPGDYNVSHGSNSFGRKASSGQPSFSGAGPNAGTSWYKWSSVKASVDYTATENQGVNGGGDIGSYLADQYKSSLANGDLLSLFLQYAPAGSNDPAGYTAKVNGWISEMVQDAQNGGGAGATTTGPVYSPDDTDTSTSSASGSSGCCSTSGSSATPGTAGETTKPAGAVQKVVWGALKAAGIDDMHAAAVMGNIANEGAWIPDNDSENPDAAQPTSQNPADANPYGYGLIGWTPGASSTVNSSLTYQLHELGMDSDPPYTAETQAAVIVAQIQGKTAAYPASVGKGFLATTDIDAATTYYQGTPGQMGFENPLDESASLPARKASARTMLGLYGGTTGTAPSGSTTASTDTGSATCCPDTTGTADTTGDDSTGSGDVTLTGSNNAQKAYNYFVSQGLSPQGAAGLVGNFQQESGPTLDTHADNGSHFGIVQWSASRWSSLLSHESGKNPYDLATQLDFAWYELNSSSYKSSVLEPLKTATSTDAAAEVVFQYYEAPGDSTLPDRQGNARTILTQYGGGAVSTGTGSSSGCASTGGSGAAGANGWDLTGPNAMVYYGQCDPKWGNQPYGNPGQSSICDAGCGITSSAMVIATLADKSQTPLTLAKKYGPTYHTDGTSFALYPVLAQDFGLKEKSIGLDFSQAAATVKAGGLVIIAVNPGHFTTEGHVMVIRAVTADGDFLLADPNNAGNKSLGRGDTNNTPYSASFLQNEGAAVQMFAFTK
jgi:hypothetical protein